MIYLIMHNHLQSTWSLVIMIVAKDLCLFHSPNNIVEFWLTNSRDLSIFLRSLENPLIYKIPWRPILIGISSDHTHLINLPSKFRWLSGWSSKSQKRQIFMQTNTKPIISCYWEFLKWYAASNTNIQSNYKKMYNYVELWSVFCKF